MVSRWRLLALLFKRKFLSFHGSTLLDTSFSFSLSHGSSHLCFGLFRHGLCWGFGCSAAEVQFQKWWNWHQNPLAKISLFRIKTYKLTLLELGHQPFNAKSNFDVESERGVECFFWFHQASKCPPSNGDPQENWSRCLLLQKFLHLNSSPRTQEDYGWKTPRQGLLTSFLSSSSPFLKTLS